MTEEIKKVLEIEFKGQQTIGDVKKEIAELKKELDACAAGSDEAAKKSLELAQAEQKLKAATKGCVDENGKLDQSYNGLVTQMAKLKAAQKQVDTSTRAGRKQYEAYAKEINKLNDQLKDLDAKNGVFSRNVGNYADSIKTAFSGMGGAVGGVFTSIASGLKMLVTNPWVAILSGIVLALKEMVNAFKRNDDAMLKVNKAFNKIKGVITLVERGFDSLVKTITGGGDIIGRVIDKIVTLGMKAAARVKSWFSKESYEEILKEFQDGWNEATDTLNIVTEKEKKLAETHIKNTTAIAKNNQKIAELNAKAADRENYTVEERRKALEDAAKLQKQNIAMEMAEAKERLAILKLKHSLNQSNNEDLQEEADLEAEIINFEAKLNDVDRNLANQKKALDKDLAKESKETLEARKKAIEQELSVTAKGTDEHLALTKERINIERQLAINDAKEKIKDANKLAETLATIKETYDKKETQAEEQHQRDLVEIKTQQLTTDAENLSKGSQAYFDKVVELKKYVLDNIKKLEGETDAAFQARLAKATDDYNKAIENAKRNAANTENQKAQNKAGEAKYQYGSNSIQYYQAELDAAQTYYDNLFQLQDESNEEYEARQIAALQNVKDAEKALNDQRLGNFMTVANGIASIMSTVAGAWEDSIKRQVEAGEISEEEGEKQFENVKAMQYAVSAINTITGAIAAYMSAQTLGFPWGQIIGAVSAAAVTAAGIAEMAKIKNTTLGGSASGGGVSAAPFQLPALESYEPQYTQNLTGQNDTADLGNAFANAIQGTEIKAYVVESDITNAQKKAGKRIEESTW